MYNTMLTQEILKVKNLTKRFGNFLAVDNVSFSVNQKEIVGLLGPNGAGKTTIINMILGVLEPTTGVIEIQNKQLNKNRTLVVEKMNFAATYSHMPGNLTVWQNLYVFGLLYGIKNLRHKINSLLHEFELEKFKNKKTGLLSSGELARLNLAKVFLNDPILILLDEPTASLDPTVAKEIRSKISLVVKEKNIAVLWTSHNMTEIEQVCDRVLFLSHGKIIISGEPKQLLTIYNKKNLEELFIFLTKEQYLFDKDPEN